MANLSVAPSLLCSTAQSQPARLQTQVPKVCHSPVILFLLQSPLPSSVYKLGTLTAATALAPASLTRGKEAVLGQAPQKSNTDLKATVN